MMIQEQVGSAGHVASLTALTASFFGWLPPLIALIGSILPSLDLLDALFQR